LASFKRNSKAIIEKPLATNRIEFQRFCDYVSTQPAVFYLCFQKRYLTFNEHIFFDFRIEKGHPINYRAIVYEVPLDNHHWYNWPKSRSRIISNGCHWIDHFLYLNQFSDPVDYWARKLSDDTIFCFIKLTNGAVFSLTLTDSGSKRQGVREYVEVSIDGFRAVIRDSMYYESESNARVIRRARSGKLQCLKDMYRQIGQAVSSDGPGDNVESLVSTKVAILLDGMLEYSVEGVAL
jgi:predicted dehydrogenase